MFRGYSVFGGAVYASAFTEFVNCTFGGNTAAEEGGAVCFEAPATGTIVNTIAWNNAPDAFFGGPTPTSSLFASSWRNLVKASGVP